MALNYGITPGWIPGQLNAIYPAPPSDSFPFIHRYLNLSTNWQIKPIFEHGAGGMSNIVSPNKDTRLYLRQMDIDSDTPYWPNGTVISFRLRYSKKGSNTAHDLDMFSVTLSDDNFLGCGSYRTIMLNKTFALNTINDYENIRCITIMVKCSSSTPEPEGSLYGIILNSGIHVT